ncbi:MAG TPA: tetratricopeptide repeat protein [Mizugakiibacter sp.]
MTLLVMALLPGAPTHAQKPPDRGSGPHVEGGGMPDFARGQAAAAAGRTTEAESNFLPLAERGYVEAQLALARLYARLHTQQSTQQAIHWFRVAAEKAPQQAEVPLARLLLQQDRTPQLAEAQRLFTHAWDDRQDPEALAGLIELYTASPGLDTQERMPTLVATAEQLDQPVTNGALIGWYRATRGMPGHDARLLSMCRKSLNVAPTCYADLLRDARARNDQKGMRQMVAVATSQVGQGLIPIDVAASIARALVAPPDGSLDAEGPAVAISDPPETDPQDLAPDTTAPAPVALGGTRACAEEPVGVAKAAPAASAQPGNAAPTNANGAAAKAPQPPAPEANAQPDFANFLLAKLIAGSAEARVEAAGVVVRFPFLAPDFDVEAALQAGLKQGLADAALYLGELYMDGDRATRDPQKALQLLQRAARDPATALAAQYYIGRLYQLGYLDEVDPQRALDHLLYAARRGYVSADSALARFYASGKGVCPNHVYAFVFAQLGARDGADAIRTLAGQLSAVLTPPQRSAAQHLLRQEEAARKQLPQIPADLAEAAPSTP